MTVFLLLIIAALVLGLIGIIAKSLVYLLAIGVGVLVVAILFGAVRFRAGGRRPPR